MASQLIKRVPTTFIFNYVQPSSAGLFFITSIRFMSPITIFYILMRVSYWI